MKHSPRLQALSALLTALAALAVFCMFAGGLCVFRIVTGIPCPGCGLTRAVTAALHGDFAAAAAYHPLWFTLPVLALLLCSAVFPTAVSRLRKALRIPFSIWRRAEWIASLVLLAAFLMVYIVRLFNGWDGISIAQIGSIRRFDFI